jgi:ketosteroid isomerase-like protein
MSRENVEIVRRIFDAFPATQDRLRSGTLPIGPPLAEGVEWDASEIALPDLGDGLMRGYEGVRRFWMTWLAAWEDVSFEYELLDAGEHVVALIDQSNRGSIEVKLAPTSYAQVWTFKDGQVIRWKLYWDRKDALEAAGLGG